ncbi:TetR/AcrR family transcriptional regulator [Terriglobus tenax]|uniref:TetR/AcrR family transcriptional regulator n=1 Tax=Terriglobus tenax TaxID=1111115 RepID=UPI0021DFECF4|nr:TetR/AcrR family transcriptional regulator [Terriglobus tenax]
MQNDTAERIKRVTHELLIERGYSAFSYADIAEAISIRKASIHHHFPTKAELVVAVLQQHREALERNTALLDEKLPWASDRLRQYLGYWEACIREQKEPFCIAALLAVELPSLPEEVQRAVKQHFEVLLGWLIRLLKAGARDGSLRLEQGAEAEAEMLMAVVHGAMSSARVAGSGQVYQVITNGVLQRLLAG